MQGFVLMVLTYVQPYALWLQMKYCFIICLVQRGYQASQQYIAYSPMENLLEFLNEFVAAMMQGCIFWSSGRQRMFN